jgi:hypothetical protein
VLNGVLSQHGEIYSGILLVCVLKVRILSFRRLVSCVAWLVCTLTVFAVCNC